MQACLHTNAHDAHYRLWVYIKALHWCIYGQSRTKETSSNFTWHGIRHLENKTVITPEFAAVSSKCLVAIKPSIIIRHDNTNGAEILISFQTFFTFATRVCLTTNTSSVAHTNIGYVLTHPGDFASNFMTWDDLVHVSNTSRCRHTNNTRPRSARTKGFIQRMDVGSTHATADDIHVYTVFIPRPER